MKWTVLNAFGGLSWLIGLEYAKGANLPIEIAHSDAQRLVVGLVFGLVGLSVLLWANVRNPA